MLWIIEIIRRCIEELRNEWLNKVMREQDRREKEMKEIRNIRLDLLRFISCSRNQMGWALFLAVWNPSVLFFLGKELFLFQIVLFLFLHSYFYFYYFKLLYVMFVFLLQYLNGWLALLLWIIGMQGIEEEGLEEAESKATEFVWYRCVAWGNWNCGY